MISGKVRVASAISFLGPLQLCTSKAFGNENVSMCHALITLCTLGQVRLPTAHCNWISRPAVVPRSRCVRIMAFKSDSKAPKMLKVTCYSVLVTP